MATKMTSYMVLFLAAMATARPLQRREVPQEHSHQKFLTSVTTSLAANNPDKVVDPVFALLGNAVRLIFLSAPKNDLTNEKRPLQKVLAQSPTSTASNKS